MLIVAFVAATRGEYGAWLLWIAIPFLMISLGYLFIISALPVFFDSVADGKSESDQEETPRKE